MNALNRTPSAWGAAFRAQLRTVGSLTRRDLIIYAIAALAIVLIASSTNKAPVMHVEYDNGGGSHQLDFLDRDAYGTTPVRGLLAIGFTYLLTGFMAFLWPMAVWRDEGPRRRAYFWSLPLSRFRNHLARVAAGGVWMLGFVAVVFLVLAIALAVSGRGEAVGTLTAYGWFNLFSAPVTLYLLSSIAALQSDRPRRTIIGFVVSLGLIYAFFGLVNFGWGHRLMYWVFEGDFSYPMAVSQGVLGDILEDTDDRGRWLAAALVWIAIGVGGVLAAARRHQER